MNLRLAFALVLITIVFLGGLVLVRTNSPTLEIEKRWSSISAAAAEQGFEPSLIAGIVYVESKGRPDVISSAGAAGLMQLKVDAASDAAKRLKIPAPQLDDLLQPELNLRLGASYLRILLNQFDGNEDLAVMAYFVGAGTVERELESSNGSVSAMKDRLSKKAGSAFEYLAMVRDIESRFRERH